jgi:hypothetical protein
MYQVLNIVVRSESSYIAWSMYLESLRLNRSYAICYGANDRKVCVPFPCIKKYLHFRTIPKNAHWLNMLHQFAFVGILRTCKWAIDLFKSGLVRQQNFNVRFVTYLLKTYHEERWGSVLKVHVCSLLEQHACSSVSNDTFFSQDQTLGQ